MAEIINLSGEKETFNCNHNLNLEKNILGPCFKKEFNGGQKASKLSENILFPPILGELNDLTQLIEQYKIKTFILACSPEADGKALDI